MMFLIFPIVHFVTTKFKMFQHFFLTFLVILRQHFAKYAAIFFGTNIFVVDIFFLPKFWGNVTFVNYFFSNIL